MKLHNIRNIGIIAHIDAGKTTVTERVLFYSGKTHRIGNVDQGNTSTDHRPDEQKRGITIVSAAVTTEWNDCQVNVIDTPGHVDFTAEVERSLRVLDGVIAVFCGVGGVQPQSETVWRQANKYNVPRIVFVNKMDREGSNDPEVVRDIEDKLGATCVQINTPLFTEDSRCAGIIDVIEQKAYLQKNPEGTEWEEVPIEGPHNNFALGACRQALFLTLGELDETIETAYYEETCDSIPVEYIHDVLRRETLKGSIVPVLTGSAFKNVGVQKLLDAAVRYLPSPLDLPDTEGTYEDNTIARKASTDEPLAALAFKIVTDSFYGKLSFVRVYSGVLKSGSYILNATKNKKVRIGRVVRIHAGRHEDVEELGAGEIAGIIGLSDVRTGDTFCDLGHPIILEEIDFPEPVISLAIEPCTRDDQKKLLTCIPRMLDEDPTLTVRVDNETGQTLISGMGELHLEIVLDRLKEDQDVHVNTGKPQVNYRETITKTVKVEGRHKAQTGGHGQYAVVKMQFEPTERGEGFIFEDRTKGGVIPKKFINSVEHGVVDALAVGPIEGYPVVDVRAILLDGDTHEVDSSELAFKIAADLAVKLVMQKAKPVLLEPIMEVEVTTPDEFMGLVIGDLNSRRGQVIATEVLDNLKVIKANAPLAGLFGYTTVLRSLASGRANYTMHFASYRIVP